MLRLNVYNLNKTCLRYLQRLRFCTMELNVERNQDNSDDESPCIPVYFVSLYNANEFDRLSLNVKNGLILLNEYNTTFNGGIINELSNNDEYINELFELLIEQNEINECINFIRFLESNNILKYVEVDLMEEFVDMLLTNNLISDVINIGIMYNKHGGLSSIIHECIGMAFCTVQWTSKIHESYFNSIVQWMYIITQQYHSYFDVQKEIKEENRMSKNEIRNRNRLIPSYRITPGVIRNNFDMNKYRELNSIDINTSNDNDDDSEITMDEVLHISQFEAFFIYITQLLARDNREDICQTIIDMVSPFITKVCKLYICM